jgi:hypothetical protein
MSTATSCLNFSCSDVHSPSVGSCWVFTTLRTRVHTRDEKHRLRTQENLNQLGLSSSLRKSPKNSISLQPT